MRIGIDLVSIERMERFLKTREAVERAFHPSERGTPEEMAGIFAAKEAVFKALRKPPNWLSVEIQKKEGAPVAVFDDKRISCTISITHEKGFAAAVAVITDGY